jgi:hypothetical protein
LQCKEMEKILREVIEKTPKNFVTALVVHSRNVTEKSRSMSCSCSCFGCWSVCLFLVHL